MEAEAKNTGRATGPRSLEGKRRSAQNARRHGLTAAALSSGALAAQVAAWRRDPDGALLSDSLLLSLAQAQQRVADVRGYQADLIAALGDRASDDVSGAQSPMSETTLHHVQLALRYRAEAEAMLRKTLRAVIAALEQLAREGAGYGKIGD